MRQTFGQTIGTNVTASGAILLGEFYQDGDKYINLENPSTTCIDNNSNWVCDATEANAPPSCRYDGAHCGLQTSEKPLDPGSVPKPKNLAKTLS